MVDCPCPLSTPRNSVPFIDFSTALRANGVSGIQHPGGAGGAADCPLQTAYGSPGGWGLLLHAFDVGAESREPLVEILVATLDLADVVNDTFTAGAQCRDHQGHAGPDVR